MIDFVPKHPSTLSTLLPLSLRLSLFRALERASDWRRRETAPPAAPATMRTGTAGRAAASLWVFASTIGEVHAIEPFLDRLRHEMGNPPLTLISDRSTYGDAYRAKYPQAQIEQLDGSSAQVASLLARDPPRLLLVAEIPTLLHDAPCRFSFATQHAARGAGAPVVLVNGWTYGYAPPSWLDRIEKQLFGRDYAAGFDLALVQTEDVKQALVASGADAGRVHVTGNLKFDAMKSPAVQAERNPLQQALTARGRGPVLVAGSVTETEHQRSVIDGFLRLRARCADALLVLAPRHPENRPRMGALHDMLQASGIDFRYRSQHEPDAAVAGAVLVLDTMGELRGCYACADAAFVGVDHNVLEPLGFGVPVFVADGWEATYPSYPVYRQLLTAGVLHDVGPISALGDAWLRYFEFLRSGLDVRRKSADDALAQARGATERNLDCMRRDPVLARLLVPASS